MIPSLCKHPGLSARHPNMIVDGSASAARGSLTQPPTLVVARRPRLLRPDSKLTQKKCPRVLRGGTVHSPLRASVQSHWPRHRGDESARFRAKPYTSRVRKRRCAFAPPRSTTSSSLSDDDARLLPNAHASAPSRIATNAQNDAAAIAVDAS